MMTFWLITAVLILIAIVMIAPSLLRKNELQELDRKAQNVSIARERLDEIAADHASGAMDDQVFEQSKLELEASMLDDVEVAPAAETIRTGSQGRIALIALLLIVPASTVWIYQQLGAPQHMQLAGASQGASAQQMAHQGQEMPSVEELVVRLKERLKENPEDGEGWFLLARTMMSQKNYAEAVEAMKKAHEIFGDHPAILLGIADGMAMTRNGELVGEPARYIEKALELEPDNQTGLWLGGMAAQQDGNYQLAVNRWTTLMPQLAENPQSQSEVLSLIAEAKRQAKEAGVEIMVAEMKMPKPAAISVNLSLSPELAGRVKPEDTVFVLAKAAKGPAMPLAAQRVTVSQLPIQITLDDSMAMMPQMKLSQFDQVIVSARVSLSGDVKAQPGDLSSNEVLVNLGGSDVEMRLAIDNVVGDEQSAPVAQIDAAPIAPRPMAEPQAAMTKAIKAWVSIDKALAGQYRPEDLVFVFAKAKAGPPMPLAAFKTRAADLPMEVTLDDSMAMMPQMKLSGFDEVVVSARISKSGQPQAQSGDLTSNLQTVALNSDMVGVELKISETVQ